MADCIIWPKSVYQASGYGQAWDSVRKKPTTAHRVAYERAHGPIPPGMVVMHACDNRLCINPDHLTIGTHAENAADKMAKGRRGEVVFGKLTAEQVAEIRAIAAHNATLGHDRWNKHPEYVTQRAMADRYGVGPDVISDIVHRRTWKKVA
jgi:hypothetical protein